MRLFVSLLVLLQGLATLSLAGKPNVLFIAVDDLNDWCGVMRGHPQAHTPNLDQLAARGVFFDRAYCAAPSCNPSRVAVLTGISAATSGMYVNDQKFRKVMPDVVTLPQFFTANGWRVAGGGKIFHHGDTDPRSWPEYFNQPRDPVPQPQIVGPVSDHFTWQPLDEPDEVMGDHKVVSWASEWIEKHHAESFFLAVGFYRPHMPLHVPRKYFDMFPLDTVQMPEVKDDDLDDVPEAAQWLLRDRGYHQKIVGAGEWKKAVQAYLASTAFFDTQLGRLMAALDASPARDNTIIVLWSDHGWHHGQKQHWSKFALWEQATRVPFLVVAPGITQAGGRCAAPVSLLDVFPTLAELCGLPLPKELEGQSLVPLLKNPQSGLAEPAVMTWGPNAHAVRDARWRYIRYADGSEELYDHDTDPREWTNLAKLSEHAAVKARLAQSLPKKNKPLITRTTWLPPSSVTLSSKPAAQRPALPDGAITVDDAQAEITGHWIESTKQKPAFGPSYRHDGNEGRVAKTAKFVPDLPAAGRYQVRVLFVEGANRSSRVPVTIRSAEGEKTIIIDQRRESQALGIFRFEKGKSVSVTLGNADADGFVVADAVVFVPEAVVGKTGAATAAPRARLQVQPVRSSTAQEINGKSYDVVVIGGTPGGIACAVRAAREGLSVLLVQHNKHIGGMLTNGLMQWDALYGGPRSPVFNEYAKMIEDYYRDAFGEGSREHSMARYTQKHYPMSRFEPSVAEHLFNKLVSAEKNITTLLSHYPVEVKREGALLRTLILREYGTSNDITVAGSTYVDATYEGDLAALAKVPCRVGRESREEYGEPHAGKVFTNIESKKGPKDVLEGKLNLHPYGHIQGSVDPTSPFTADGAIQVFCHRFCLSNEPGNIRLPEKPPGYNRDEYVNYNRKGMSAGAINGKSSFNSAILPGENHAYPDASWPEREKIIGRHTNFALGLMYFLQNDESVSPAKRDGFRRIGLPLDEYTDNHNLPYELYVREARRIVGRHIFTEHDNMAAPGQARPPIHADSIAFTDWSMDSHDCTTDRRPGYDYDGKLILTEESRPAQIPYRCLLPKEIDNLLVPACLSATHVAWGAVRLEPVWMQTGEAAGFAAALAKKHQTTPGKLDSDLLVRTLVSNKHFVTFFNELQEHADHPAMPAAQYLGTKGFFADYNARLDEPTRLLTARAWVMGVRALHAGKKNTSELTTAIAQAESRDGASFRVRDWREILEIGPEAETGERMMTRGEVLRECFRLSQ